MTGSDRSFRLRERDGVALAAWEWSAGEPSAVMVVAHGMGEHAARYRTPLQPLIDDGYAIYALDHRGHGASVGEGGSFGDYGPGGYQGVVSDLAALVDQARAEHPGLPVVLFGHSMGSMIAQGYVLDHSAAIDALVLCGSVAVDAVAGAVQDGGDVLAAMNAQFEPGRTGFEWLSRDEAEVDKYIADPWCGFGLTPESFGELFANAPRLADPERIAAIRPTLPIYIISGDHDPLVALLHGLDPLIARYEAAGLDVTAKLYPEARHELLNETNRDDVVADLAAWLARAT